MGKLSTLEAITDSEKHVQKLNRVYSVLSNIFKTIVRVRDKQFIKKTCCSGNCTLKL